MTRASFAFAAPIALALLLGGCGTPGSPAPEITPAVVSAGARQHVTSATLEAGRTQFVNRCAACHTLPAPAAHSAGEWPGLVAKMSKRAGLSAAQGQEVLAYVLAARP